MAVGLVVVSALTGCMSGLQKDAPGTMPNQPKVEDLVRPSRRVTIRDPGPDLANFPNASFTLPKGGIYVENSPVGFQGSSPISEPQYNWEFLLRYGLTDNIELRLFSQGFTIQGQPNPATGFSPLAFDTKIHLAKRDWDYFNYSLGVEAYVQTTWGSEAFDAGTQFSLTLLVDHTLPWDIGLSWNLGYVRTQDQVGKTVHLPSFQWAFQRNVVDDFAVFIQGYMNATALPRVTPSGSTVVELPYQHVVGGGFQWILNDRMAVFGSYNRATDDFAPSYVAYFGFALAF